MPTEHPNLHIISGGPGAGKTTLIEALRARGFRTVDESGRQIIRAQKAIGGNAFHTGDQRLYAELMLSQAMLDHERLARDPSPAFFDRGVPELAGYFGLVGLATPAHFVEAARVYRYAPVVFIAPPWEAIYSTDAERKQDFAEAVESCACCQAAYAEAGYTTVDLPKGTVTARVEFILARAGM